MQLALIGPYAQFVFTRSLIWVGEFIEIGNGKDYGTKTTTVRF